MVLCAVTEPSISLSGNPAYKTKHLVVAIQLGLSEDLPRRVVFFP